jgi:flagellin
MKELATQAASTNTGSTDRTNISAEVDNLESEISRIANSTKYAGTALINGSFGSLGISALGSLQARFGIESVDVSSAGAATDYSITIGTSTANSQITISDGTTSQTLTAATLTGLNTDTMDFSSLGVKITVNSAFNDDAENTISAISTLSTSTTATSSFQVGYENNANNSISFTLSDLTAGGLTADVNVGSLSGAQTALTTIDTAIDTLATARSVIGRSQNQFGFAIANLASSVENMSAAESTIRDADMALETVAFTKNQILLQAGTAMLAQANASTQAVLQLLG